MNIPFRLKFFIVLLCFSLGPMLISRVLVGGAARKVEGAVTEHTRAELLQIVNAELEQQAENLLTSLEQKGQTITLAIRMLAQNVEQALFWPPEENLGKPYLAKDFGMMGEGPPDMVPSELYTRRTRSGESRSLNISLESPAFIDKGKTPKTMAQTRQLQGLLPIFKLLYSQRSDAANWYNVGLESGVFATYPGHGMFPMNYDHREQEWYQKAKNVTDYIAWVAPAIDPASRRVVSIGSHPIYDLNEQFTGAVSIDIPITWLLSDGALRSKWSNEIKSFMVMRASSETTQEEGLYIVAQHAYEEGGQRHWRSGIEGEWLAEDDPGTLVQLLIALKKDEAGTLHLPYKGVDSLWAYASNDEFSFILIASEEVVNELPDEVNESITTFIAEMRDIGSIISGVVLILVGIIAWFGSSRMTRPVLLMAEKAKRLAKGDFSVRVDHRYGDERDVMANSFNEMVPQLKERLSMQRDMELAQGVQNLLLPTESPSLPGFDISGGIAYCDQTGGDYYDFIDLCTDDGCGLGVVLGDVSGHGAPAALIMAAARGQLHALSSVILTPAERINTVNRLLAQDLDGTGRFITMFYLRLKGDDPTVRWVRAGHDPAIRYCRDTDTFSELNGEGLALGVLGEYEYQDYEATLASNEVLAIATDGVWEARNVEDEMFGKQRMLAIIKENAHKSAEAIRISIMDAVDQFQANGQEDDIAVVIIKKD